MPQRNPNADNFTLADSPTPANSEQPKKKPTFLRVPLNDDGSIDTTRVSASTIERVRVAVGTEPAKAPEPERPAIVINRDFIPGAYSLLEVIIRRAGRALLKWPPDLAAEMQFSEEKKAKLVEPTAKVLERFAPLWLIENQDIAALVAVLSDAVDDMIQKGTVAWATKHPDQFAAMMAEQGVIVEVPPTPVVPVQ